MSPNKSPPPAGGEAWFENKFPDEGADCCDDGEGPPKKSMEGAAGAGTGGAGGGARAAGAGTEAGGGR
jgi:hypothetical protein